MKKILNQTLALLAGATFFASCAKEWTIIPNEFAQDGAFTISATLEDLGTKVSFGAPSYTGGKPSGSMATTWESGDKLRVYNHADHSQYSDFTLDEGAGTKSASFTGSPVAASSYDVEVIDCSGAAAATVTMASDGAVANLKYLATATSVTDLTQISFANVSSVLAVTAKLPAGVAGTITSVKMTASEDIFFGGNEQTINITTPGDAGSDNILHLFATLPEGDVNVPAGTTILVKFNSNNAEHEVYTRFVEMAATTFDANACNTININATASATHAGLATADGSTSAKAYLIGDKYQMHAVNDEMVADETKYFKMVDDIDMDGEVWTALNGPSPYNRFVDFDGNNKTISNLGKNLFYVLKGSIYDLTLDYSHVTTRAILTEYVQGTGNTISNVTVSNGSLSRNGEKVGGLIAIINSGSTGVTSVTIDGCKVINTNVIQTEGTKSGNVGGLVGYVDAQTVITDCEVSKNDASTYAITCLGDYAGGLIGNINATATVSNCSVSGVEVSGVSKVGGLVGSLNAGTLTGNTTSGNVSGTTFYTGGLIGMMLGGSVTNCSAACDVINTRTNYAHAGGLIGRIEGNGGTVSKCHSAGSVTITGSSVGGLVGTINTVVTIEKSYSTTSVSLPTDKRDAGGLVGKLDADANVTVSDCYTAGTITGNNYIGGLVGDVNSAATLTVTRGYSTTALAPSGAGWSAGVFAGADLSGVTNLSVSGYVGWVNSKKSIWCYKYETGACPAGNYIGTSGSVYSQAVALGGWDFTNVWTTDSEPKLR